MSRYAGQWLLFAMALGNLVAAIFCAASFLVADTPQQALKRGIPMPSHWEAGVLNHDHYFEWYSLAQHPFAFGGSVVWMFAALVAVLYLRRELRQ
jgi:hypothetical protein